MTSHPPPLPETSPGDTWNQSLLTNFLSFNPPQYKSNHHKQHSLITTSKNSHCLLQLQIRNSLNFHLQSVCNYEIHTPTPHILAELGIIFPSLGSCKKILKILCLSRCWILTEGSLYQNWKAYSYSPLLGNDLGLLNRNFDLLTIRALMYIQCN